MSIVLMIQVGVAGRVVGNILEYCVGCDGSSCPQSEEALNGLTGAEQTRTKTHPPSHNIFQRMCSPQNLSGLVDD